MARRITGGVVGSTAVADIFSYITVTAPTYTTTVGELLWIDTTSNAITVTLPPNPSEGATIRFVDVSRNFDVNALTIDRNSRLIQGDADNMTVNTPGAAFDLVYYNETFGWRIFSI